jgi:branched-chain amino acid transport system ATP-binding protein
MRLELTDIDAYYGQSHILQGVSLRVAEGEVVALVGRNGACKTTTMRSITGLTVHQNLTAVPRP